MTEVTLDTETLDRITVAGLKNWRAECLNCDSIHPEDIATDAMRVAAIDVLLAFLGSPARDTQ